MASGSSARISDKAKVDKFGQMAPCMKAGGKTTKPMVREDSFTPTEMFTMASGSTIKLMDSEFTAISTEQSMRVTGKKINSTAMGLKHGLTVPDMKDNIFKEKNMVMEDLPGLTAAHIMESL